jgi:hypothetical protein
MILILVLNLATLPNSMNLVYYLVFITSVNKGSSPLLFQCRDFIFHICVPWLERAGQHLTELVRLDALFELLVLEKEALGASPSEQR